jgi:glycolate oxidase iron-sulfur subunit
MVPVTPEALIATADRCVKCGLCLPHCPTYSLYRDEAESPRGRISLVQGLIAGDLDDTPALRAHLDRCLLCRNCERACPSQVAYGELMDGVRARLAAGEQPDWLLQTLTNGAVLRKLLPLGALARKTGVAKGLPGIFRRLADLAPRPRSEPVPEITPFAQENGRVALFGGCVGSVTDRRALSATRLLLSSLGFEVVTPAASLCCGAMHRHGGFAGEAAKRLEETAGALSGLAVDAVLTVASGCGAQLVEHAGLSSPVRDISAFLAEVAWPESMLGVLRGQVVALHQPCSLRNVMREDGGVAKLLSRFDGLEVVLVQGESCCGAAGMHMVAYPEMAKTLAAPVVEQVRRAGLGTLLTSNTGCALHLDAELDAAGVPVAVRHPVEWLVDHLAQHNGSDK